MELIRNLHERLPTETSAKRDGTAAAKKNKPGSGRGKITTSASRSAYSNKKNEKNPKTLQTTNRILNNLGNGQEEATFQGLPRQKKGRRKRATRTRYQRRISLKPKKEIKLWPVRLPENSRV